jgi:hypothetical protein
MRNESNWYVHDDGVIESNWINIDPRSGEIAHDQETDVSLVLDADFCIDGVYEANVNVLTNDPDDEMITVAVSLEVEGAPDIRVGWQIGSNENIVNWNNYFEEVFSHGEYGVEVLIRNAGTDVLHVNNIQCENNAFIAAPVRFNLGVNETENVYFFFRPNNAGEFESVMVISSDDPDQPQYEVNLRAHVFVPPMIVISPLEIEEMLLTGEQSEFSINVSNDGEADLQWHTEIEIISEPGRDTIAYANGVYIAGARTNVTIRGFTVAGDGDYTIFTNNEGSINIYNCIVLDDSHFVWGIDLYGGGTDTVLNCIVDGAHVGIGVQYNSGQIYNSMFINCDIGYFKIARYEYWMDYGWNLFWNNGENYGYEEPQPSDVFADPQFILGSYNLSRNSPAIDYGNPDLKDKDGSRSDIGIYGGLYSY